MMTEININFLIPTDWQRFETISLEALKIMYNNPNFTKHGRPGQKQDGVDIYLQINNEIIAAQCKLTFKVIDKKIIREEIEKAKKFIPKISVLYICTTSPKDARLQETVRFMTLDEGIQCYIWFWDDIIEHIKSKEDVFNMLFANSMYTDSKDIHDITIINKLLSTVDVSSIQKTLEEQLPEFITPEFTIYFDAFNESYQCVTTYFYNSDLDTIVRNFYECWNSIILVTCIEFQPLNGGRIYGFYRNYSTFNTVEYEEKIKKINQLRIDMHKSLFDLVAFIKNKYPIVNLDELSLNAIRMRQSAEKYIKSLDG